jgi:hypothetical protein
VASVVCAHVTCRRVWSGGTSTARRQATKVTPLPTTGCPRSQEWRNAVTLFVNVRGKTGSVYSNLFSDSGRQMAWFAQPSQTIASPVIHRMLVEDPLARPTRAPPFRLFCALPPFARMRRLAPPQPHDRVVLTAAEPRWAAQAVAKAKSEVCPVLLFCRQEGEPYVYAGRLR